MKKILNLILALLSLTLLAFLVALQVNVLHPFITLPAEHLTTINYVVKYGTMVVLSAWVLVYFLGKGPIKILLAIIAIIVIASGVIVFGFPEVVIKLLK